MEEQYVPGNGFKIISGGQSGADQAGLDWALENHFPHGGWCPKGRKTEAGLLSPQYLLTETPSASYLQRTEWNVRDSDATLIFTLSDSLSGGSKRTAEFADRHGKPWLHVRPGVHPKYVARFLARHTVGCLNIAGSRASTAPGVGAFVRVILTVAIVLPDAVEAHARPAAAAQKTTA